MKKNYSIVAIVGRVNVGKSTLFNRVSAKVKSIVLDYEGVTRDPIRSRVTWHDCTFELVDTAGLFADKIKKGQKDSLTKQMEERAQGVLEQADVVILVIDGVVGVLDEDRAIAKQLHRLNKKVVIAINKGDNPETNTHLYEAHELSFEYVHTISAYHGDGVYELFDEVIALLPACGKAEVEQDPLVPRIAFIGRPNVGKSSLLNALLGEDRAIVSAIAGTTREPIAQEISFYRENLILIDTPGIRRQRGVEQPLEKLMVHTALQTLKDADVVVMLIDSSEADIVDQELKLAFYAFEERQKGLVILFNKSDLIDETKKADLERVKEQYQHLLAKVPTLSISVKTGKNVGKVLPLVHEVWKRYIQSFDNTRLQMTCVEEFARKPMYRITQHLVINSVRQMYSRPPTILLMVNQPLLFKKAQLSFVENIMRTHYDLLGVPIKIVLQKG